MLQEIKDNDNGVVDTSFAAVESAESTVPEVTQTSSGGVGLDSSGTPWQECLDPSSGHIYYWNTVTNDVSWTLPEGWHEPPKTTKKKGKKLTKDKSPVEPVKEPTTASAAPVSVEKQPAAFPSLVSYDVGLDSSLDKSDVSPHDATDAVHDDDSDCNFEHYDEDHKPSPVPSASASHNERDGSATQAGGDGDSDCNFEHYDDSDCNIEQYDSDHDRVATTSQGRLSAASSPKRARASSVASSPKRARASSVASSPKRARASSTHSSPQRIQTEGMFEDSDPDCNIVSYDGDEESAFFGKQPSSTATPRSERTKDTPSSSKKRNVEGIDFDLVPYNDKELADVLFADPKDAIKLGFGRVLKSEGSPSSSGAEDNSKSKPRSAGFKSGASIAIPPRSVRLSQAKAKKPLKTAAAKTEPMPAKDVKEGHSAKNLDMFADEHTTGEKEVLEKKEPAEASPVADDVDMFDVDAVLEESLASAMARPSNSPQPPSSHKRPAVKREESGNEADAEAPAAKRSKTESETSKKDDGEIKDDVAMEVDDACGEEKQSRVESGKEPAATERLPSKTTAGVAGEDPSSARASPVPMTTTVPASSTSDSKPATALEGGYWL